jgi:hypothetical protein
MATEAGCLPGSISRMNGTKKLPQVSANVKVNTFVEGARTWETSWPWS